MKKIKVITFLIMVFILEVIALILSSITQSMHTLGVKKYSFDEICKDGLNNIMKSPINCINSMIEAENPIFFLLCIGAIILAAIFVFKMKDKNFEFERKYTVHGANRFSEEKELIRGEKLYFAKEKHILEDFYESIGGMDE